MLTDLNSVMRGKGQKKDVRSTFNLASTRMSRGASLLSRRLTHCLTLTMILLYNLSATSAYAVTTDSLAVEEKEGTEYYRFHATQLILPATLITLGAIGVKNEKICDLKYNIKENMDQWRGEKRCHIDNGLQYLPVAAYLGLDYIGMKSKHNLPQRIAVSATSYTIMIAISESFKHTVKEGRPNSPLSFNSFPSGHTATAFTGAELLRIEYGNKMGIASYTFASGIAFMRLFNNRHWLNDVVTGAGIGILSARIGSWLLPLETRLFKLDRGKHNLSVIPTCNPSDQHFGAIIFAEF
ncbi:MAG: phosphatase PAP2 family protein [Paludibacteraceae bacterium]|nr:phosphatase PAP2 family protein [Paludibacteraceae bacterium]